MRQRLGSIARFYGSPAGRLLLLGLLATFVVGVVGGADVATLMLVVVVAVALPALSASNHAMHTRLNDLTRTAAELDQRILTLRADVERRPTRHELRRALREVRREHRDVARSLREGHTNLRRTLNSQEELEVETRSRLEQRRRVADRLEGELQQLRASIDAYDDRIAGLKGSVGSLVERQQRVMAQLREEQTTIVSDGSARHFYLAPGYRRRSALDANFDDTENEDLWQREVYDHALAVAKQIGATTVCDFGCGSGFKLMDRFSEFETVGIDVPATVSFLREKYPNRTWRETGHVSPEMFDGFDVVIASDVIEHLEDPTALLRALAESSVREIILSTPARELLVAKGHRRLGPPGNVHHYLEWTVEEFGLLVGDHLEIVRHEISNSDQATQLVHARPAN